ncbi:hypothetical protein CBW65_20225 [Tumebacillus avium]|uniref:Sporulation stage II protein D amidase enhancer LytB N-terminal domain-containing protein n=1 Tax=Tumebacillus avium TaxID=1903704 RepID=A0A1Y0IS05_9BACL|nr:SpoIID/LytB domain-containing protein [Tumebacillus avium]ARU63040.1 hypothetical protein CBW65_20225 [Tumebacillus avium]
MAGTLLFAFGSSSYASSDESQVTVLDRAFQVVQQEIFEENANQWVEISNNWVSSQAALMDGFLVDPEHAKSNRGLFTIKHARITESKKVTPDVAKTVSNYDQYVADYGEAHVYYIGVDYKVRKESEFYINGVNYMLAVVVPENDEYKLIEMSVAPVDIFNLTNNGFGTVDEKNALKIRKELYKGKVVNRIGEVIKTNIATQEQLQKEKGFKSLNNLTAPEVTGDHVRPNSIPILLEYPPNRSNYGCTTAVCVRDIPFYDYVKDVLPNEWGPAWRMESLKAGAMGVKMFGWYRYYNKLLPQYGASLYDTQKSQAYVVNSSAQYTATTNAINAVGGIGMENASTHALFEAQYAAGISGSPGTQYSGVMTQYGTKYWADSGPYLFDWMLHYYYDYSPKTGATNKLGFFTY